MRVLVVDDHSLFRDGVVSLLEAAGYNVIGQAGNGKDGVELARNLHPDLVLLDVNMPVMGGLEALIQIKYNDPNVQVVMLTVSEEESILIDTIKAGASGYLLKHFNSQAFLKALDGLQHGEAAITRSAATKIMKSLSDLHHQAPAKEKAATVLSDREIAILRLVAEGLSNSEVAQSVSLSENTVKYYLKNILQKLNVHNRTEAVTTAIRNGLLEQRKK